jgi:hypothetical protein
MSRISQKRPKNLRYQRDLRDKLVHVASLKTGLSLVPNICNDRVCKDRQPVH